MAALRFELQSNLGWLDDILETRNYLRDEAWVEMKNRGYISYLRRPIPRRVITTYNRLHALNQQIYYLKHPDERDEFSTGEADNIREDLRDSILDLIALLDKTYPRVGRNFKETRASPRWSINQLDSRQK